MLIIEGSDGAGKTTLCRKLLQHLPGHIYAHFSRLPPEFDYYWGYAERMSCQIVQDRFHLSEIVYSRAREQVSILSPEMYLVVDAKLRLLGAYTLLVLADDDLIRSRWDQTQMYDSITTVSANRIFRNLPHEFPEYRIDIDHVFHCTEKVPYVDDFTIHRILEEYLNRQKAINSITARRPYRL
jgi:thymidylate kinase